MQETPSINIKPNTPLPEKIETEYYQDFQQNIFSKMKCIPRFLETVEQ